MSVKHLVDFNIKIGVKPDDAGVELANVKMSMNPFDEIAVEEAVRLNKASKATEIRGRIDWTREVLRNHPRRARHGRRL